MTIDTDFAELKQRLQTIDDLRNADRSADLGSVHVHAARRRRGARPPARAAGGLAHERLSDPAIGRLLDSLAPWAEAQGADSDAAALIRVTRRDYDRATRVPSEFVAAAERAHRDDLPRMAARAPGQRLRRRAAAARDDGRAEPRARGVLSRLRAPVRRAHRPRRGRHDGGGGARALRRVARRPRAADRGHPRAPAARRPLPRPAISRSRRSRRFGEKVIRALRLRLRRAAARTRPRIRS